MTRILGIETSCDETAIGIVEDGRVIRANAIATSLAHHAPYGGVIPEIAARLHVETIWDVLSQALQEARCTLNDIDAFAVTQGPGLPGALLVGVAFAKGLALALDRPLVAVDHLAAHLYAGEMSEPEIEPPYIGLIVSGGHTLLCAAYGEGKFEVLGQTHDDAVGEAFDKVAKLLGLGYPGGPPIDRIAPEGKADRIAFPRSQSKHPLDFSFSGLKTAVFQHLNKPAQHNRPSGENFSGDRQAIADVAASFQEAAVDMLLVRTARACQRTGITRIVVGGGVAANSRLRQRFAEAASSKKWRVVFPPPSLCMDNGAMVAGVAFGRLQRGLLAPLHLTADPDQCLV